MAGAAAYVCKLTQGQREVDGVYLRGQRAQGHNVLRQLIANAHGAGPGRGGLGFRGAGREPAMSRVGREPHAHRAVLADALAALDGFVMT